MVHPDPTLQIQQLPLVLGFEFRGPTNSRSGGVFKDRDFEKCFGLGWAPGDVDDGS